MQYKFFALISRMRYIARWGLMRNTFQETLTAARRRRCSTTRPRS